MLISLILIYFTMKMWCEWLWHCFPQLKRIHARWDGFHYSQGVQQQIRLTT